jgi:VWFA-related protein
LFIEPASGAILRVTRQAANIPAGFPTRRSDTAVEYRPVNIGGKSWLCPVSSITSSDNSLEHLRENPNALEMHTLNVVQFTDYHKFGSESTLVMADIPATGQIDVSAPSMAPIEPPPELTATYQPASVPSLLFGRVESLPPPPSPKAPEAPVEGQAIFRVRTNVVTVRVVVRDRNGHPVGDLRKEEFELRDNGQPQTISSFSVERPTTAALQPISPEHGTKMGGEQAVVHEAVQVAYRYVMYVVDDLNIEFGDLSQTRTAAERVLRDSPNSASRVAVLTTSGRIITDFTSNLAEINKALDRITPQGRANAKGRCPPLSHGLALAVTQGYGLMLAIAEAKACGLVNDPSNPRAPSGPDSTVASAQRGVVLSVANQVVNEYRTQTRTVLEALKVAVRRISIVPGSRTLVLVSPGFLTPDLELEVNEVIDRAIRAGVVINTLDSRGVWVLPGFDAETRPLGDPAMDRAKRQSDEQEQQAQSYILGHLAAETGGLAFQSNNDYQEGFRRLTAAPQVSYVLGFTPTKLKPDGSFHILKVNIGTRKGLTAQARNGYFAPKRGIDPTEQAKEEIENAVFSRDEIQDIPVTLRTQMTQGKLSAVAHFGIGGIRFVQKDGRNRSSLTATVSLFDAVGNYLKGEQDIVNLDFPDDKLASAEASGDAVRADFEVPAGSYVVRLVLRDNDGHMSATSMIVTVP